MAGQVVCYDFQLVYCSFVYVQDYVSLSFLFLFFLLYTSLNPSGIATFCDCIECLMH